MFLLLSYWFLGMAAGPLVMCAGFSIAQREAMPWVPSASVGWTTSLAASAFLGSVLAYAASATPQIAALVAWLVIIGLVLALVDWACQLLPHYLVGTLFGGGLIQIGFAALVFRDFAALLRAGIAAVVVFAVGYLLYLRLGAALGFGDVTLAAALALFLGWCGWSYVSSGLFVGLLASGAATRMLVALRRISRRDHVALGPSLLVGAVYVMLQA